MLGAKAQVKSSHWDSSSSYTFLVLPLLFSSFALLSGRLSLFSDNTATQSYLMGPAKIPGIILIGWI